MPPPIDKTKVIESTPPAANRITLRSNNSKRRRGIRGGGLQGSIRVNENSYQAFVNPILIPSVEEQHPFQDWDEEAENKMNCSVKSNDTETVDNISASPLTLTTPFMESSESDTNVLLINPFCRSNLTCNNIPSRPIYHSPYRAYSSRLFDDSVSSISSFLDPYFLTHPLTMSPSISQFSKSLSCSKSEESEFTVSQCAASPIASGSSSVGSSASSPRSSESPIPASTTIESDDGEVKSDSGTTIRRSGIRASPPTGRLPPTRSRVPFIALTGTPSRQGKFRETTETNGSDTDQRGDNFGRIRLESIALSIYHFLQNETSRYLSQFQKQKSQRLMNNNPHIKSKMYTDSNYYEQNYSNENLICISGSHEFAFCRLQVGKFETLFCNIDPLAWDSELFRHVTNDIIQLVKDRRKAGGTLTINQCWNHRGLIQYLVKKHTPIILQDSVQEISHKIKDQIYHGVGTGSIIPSVEMNIWSRITREGNYQKDDLSRWSTTMNPLLQSAVSSKIRSISSECHSEFSDEIIKTCDSEDSKGLMLFNSVNSIETTVMTSDKTVSSVLLSSDKHLCKSSVNSSTELISKNKSQTFSELCREFQQFSSKLSHIASWKEHIIELYRLHQGHRANLETAIDLHSQGQEIRQYCNVTNDLVILENDIQRCTRFRNHLINILPELMDSSEPLKKKTSYRIPLSLLQPLIVESESLPFTLNEQDILTHYVKESISWQNMVAAAVTENNLDRCEDLLEKEPICNITNELSSGVNQLREDILSAQWFEKLEKIMITKKSFLLCQLYELVSEEGLHLILRLIDHHPLVKAFYSRCRLAFLWLYKVKNEPFVTFLTSQDRIEVDKVYHLLCRLIILKEPHIHQSANQQKSGIFVTPTAINDLCSEYSTARISLNAFKTLETLRQRIKKWMRRYQRVVTGRGAVILSDVVSVLKDGLGFSNSLDLRHELKELSTIINHYEHWIIQVDTILKHLRETIIQTDLSYISNHLLSLNQLFTPTLIQGEFVFSEDNLLSEETLLGFIDLSSTTQRPELNTICLLLSEQLHSPIIDQERERQLRQIKENGERWKKRARDLLKTCSTQHLSVDRMRIQLLLEAKSLCMHNELEEQLLAEFFLKYWRKKVQLLTCPIKEKDVIELYDLPMTKKFELLLSRTHSATSFWDIGHDHPMKVLLSQDTIDLPLEPMIDQTVIDLPVQHSQTGSLKKEDSLSVLTNGEPANATNELPDIFKEELVSQSQPLAELDFHQPEISHIVQTTILSSIVNETTDVQSSPQVKLKDHPIDSMTREQLFQEIISTRPEYQCLPSFYNIIQKWTHQYESMTCALDVPNSKKHSFHDWNDVLHQLKQEPVVIESIENAILKELSIARVLEEKIKELPSVIELSLLLELKEEVQKCHIYLQLWDDYETLLSYSRIAENEIHVLLTSPLNPFNTSELRECLDHTLTNICTIPGGKAIYPKSLNQFDLLHLRLQHAHRWTAFYTTIETTPHFQMSIEKWKMFLKEANDEKFHSLQIYNLKNHIQEATIWIYLYTFLFESDQSPQSSIDSEMDEIITSRLELDIAQILVQYPLKLGPKLTLFVKLKDEVCKAEHIQMILPNLLETSKNQVDRKYFYIIATDTLPEKSKYTSQPSHHLLEKHQTTIRFNTCIAEIIQLTKQFQDILQTMESFKYVSMTQMHYRLLFELRYRTVHTHMALSLRHPHALHTNDDLQINEWVVPLSTATQIIDDLKSIEPQQIHNVSPLSLPKYFSTDDFIQQNHPIPDEFLVLLTTLRERIELLQSTNQTITVLQHLPLPDQDLHSIFIERYTLTKDWVNRFNELGLSSSLPNSGGLKDKPNQPAWSFRSCFQWPSTLQDIQLMLRIHSDNILSSNHENGHRSLQESASSQQCSIVSNSIIPHDTGNGHENGSGIGKQSRRIKHIGSIKKVTSLSNVTDIFLGQECDLTFGDLLDEPLIRLVSDYIKKCDLKTERFHLNMGRIQSMLTSITHNNPGCLLFPCRVIQAHTAKPLCFIRSPYTESWMGSRLRLKEPNDQSIVQHDMSVDLIKQIVPTIVDGLILLQDAMKHIYFFVKECEFLRYCVCASVLCLNAIQSMCSKKLIAACQKEFSLGHILQLDDTDHLIVSPNGIQCHTDVPTLETVVDIVEQLDLLPFQISLKDKLIKLLCSSFQWNTAIKHITLLLPLDDVFYCQDTIKDTITRLFNLSHSSHDTLQNCVFEMVVTSFINNYAISIKDNEKTQFEHQLSTVSSPYSVDSVSSHLLKTELKPLQQDYLLILKRLTDELNGNELGICYICASHTYSNKTVIDDNLGQWVSCDECQRWFHSHCVGLPIDLLIQIQTKELDTWRYCCPICLIRKYPSSLNLIKQNDDLSMIIPNIEQESFFLFTSPWFKLWLASITHDPLYLSPRLMPNMNTFLLVIEGIDSPPIYQSDKDLLDRRLALLLLWCLDVSIMCLQACNQLHSVNIPCQLSFVQQSTIVHSRQHNTVSTTPIIQSHSIKYDSQPIDPVPIGTQTSRPTTRSSSGVLQPQSVKTMLQNGYRHLKLTGASPSFEKTRPIKKRKRSIKFKNVIQLDSTAQHVTDSGESNCYVKESLNEFKLFRPGCVISSINDTLLDCNSTHQHDLEIKPLCVLINTTQHSLRHWISDLNDTTLWTLDSFIHFWKNFLTLFVTIEIQANHLINSPSVSADIFLNGWLPGEPMITRIINDMSSSRILEFHPSSYGYSFQTVSIGDQTVLPLWCISRCILTAAFIGIKDLPGITLFIQLLIDLQQYDQKLASIQTYIMKYEPYNDQTPGIDVVLFNELFPNIPSEFIQPFDSIKRIMSAAPLKGVFGTPTIISLSNNLMSIGDTIQFALYVLQLKCPKFTLGLSSIDLSFIPLKNNTPKNISDMIVDDMLNVLKNRVRDDIIDLFKCFIQLNTYHDRIIKLIGSTEEDQKMMQEVSIDTQSSTIINSTIEHTTNISLTDISNPLPVSTKVNSLTELDTPINTAQETISVDTVQDILKESKKLWDHWISCWNQTIRIDHQSMISTISSNSIPEQHYIQCKEEERCHKRPRYLLKNELLNEHDIKNLTRSSNNTSPFFRIQLRSPSSLPSDESLLPSDFFLFTLKQLEAFNFTSIQLQRRIVALNAARRQYISVRHDSTVDSKVSIVSSTVPSELSLDDIAILEDLGQPMPPKLFTLVSLDHLFEEWDHLHLEFTVEAKELHLFYLSQQKIAKQLEENHTASISTDKFIIPQDQYNDITFSLDESPCNFGTIGEWFLEKRHKVDRWIQRVRQMTRRLSISSCEQSDVTILLASALSLKKDAHHLIVDMSRTRLFADLRRLIRDIKKRQTSCHLSGKNLIDPTLLSSDQSIVFEQQQQQQQSYSQLRQQTNKSYQYITHSNGLSSTSTNLINNERHDIGGDQQQASPILHPQQSNYQRSLIHSTQSHQNMPWQQHPGSSGYLPQLHSTASNESSLPPHFLNSSHFMSPSSLNTSSGFTHNQNCNTGSNISLASPYPFSLFPHSLSSGYDFGSHNFYTNTSPPNGNNLFSYNVHSVPSSTIQQQSKDHDDIDLSLAGGAGSGTLPE